MLKIELPEKEIQRALRNLRFYEVDTKDQVKKEVALSAFAIQKEAKERVRTDTSRLKNSIEVDILQGGAAAEVGTNVHYAPHQEFGTRYMVGKPFLYPAFEAERNKFLAKMAEVLKIRKKV